jgi:imidazoleglycerol phosphate synthase glutamine amidotransferase subunit HisH
VSESDFRFFPARQVPEIILNEYSRNTENALFEWLEKETTRYFVKSKYTWSL